ncbi:hypothetical protein BS78_03G407600 [Paspalum vaginatum]|nr:hypothetical protein BS78_03G407600 [Paspalum vaginatum]
MDSEYYTLFENIASSVDIVDQIGHIDFFIAFIIPSGDESDINRSHAATIALVIKSAMQYLPGFITQKSLEARSYDGSMIPDSRDYFVFACQYGDKSSNNVSRLVSGMVFNLNVEVVGVVVNGTEDKLSPQTVPSLSTIYHKEY